MTIWSAVGVVDEIVAATLPSWLTPVVDAVRGLTAESVSRFLPIDGQGRHSAVLILIGEGLLGPDVLLIQRATTLRTHAGEPAFPGGALDEDDLDAAAAAVREAREETGLDSRGVRVFGQLPDLWVPVNDFVVSPVVAWWSEPSPVRVEDVAEVAAVHRIPIAELTDPVNRCQVRHPSGHIGPGFTVREMLVWGFTGGVLSTLIERSGWSRPWSPGRIVDVGPW